MKKLVLSMVALVFAAATFAQQTSVTLYNQSDCPVVIQFSAKTTNCLDEETVSDPIQLPANDDVVLTASFLGESFVNKIRLIEIGEIGVPDPLEISYCASIATDNDDLEDCREEEQTFTLFFLDNDHTESEAFITGQ